LRKSVARGALLGIAGQAWHLAATFVLYAFLTRQLGPALFGQWRVVLSVLGWFEIVLASGITTVATMKMAENPDEVPSRSRAVYVGQAVAVVVVLVLMLALASPLASVLLSDPALATYIRISALDVPLYALLMAASAVLLGQHRFERQVVALMAYSATKLVAIGVLVAVGFSVPGALVGNAVASLVGFLVSFVRLPKREAAAESLKPLVRAMYIGAIPFLTLNLVEGVGQSADLWLVSAVVVSATAVGWYASATVLAEIPVFLFDGLARVMFPSIARAHAENDGAMSSRYAVQSVRLGIIVTVLGVGLVAGGGRQVLELLYSSAYVGAFVPLAILMVASIGRVVRLGCTQVLMVRDQRRLAIVILVVTIAVELVLLPLLASSLGVAGAAAAASLAALAGGAWAAFSVRDLLGIRPLYTLGRCAIAAAIVGVVLARVPLSPVAVLVAFPVGALVYAGIISLLGEIDRDDVASVRTALSR